MNISVSAKQGALYGFLAHLLILIGGQLIFILLLGIYGSPVEVSVIMLKSLELNAYAFTFFALLLAGGWLVGYKLTLQIVEKKKGVFSAGLLSGILVAVFTIAYWLIVSFKVNGVKGTIPVLKQPAILAFIVFIIHWLIVAAIIKRKAKQSV